MSTIKRGALIVFEGIDRSGKSTQVALLAAALEREGRSTCVIRFPDRTSFTGKIIDAYLAGTGDDLDLGAEALHRLFAANRSARVEEIVRHLISGTTVILDRYVHSGLVFSQARGLDKGWCKDVDLGKPQPDLVVYMSLPPSESMKRDGFGAEKCETPECQEKAAALFDELTAAAATTDPEPAEQWFVADATRAIDEIHQQILPVVKQAIESSANKKIGVMWCDDPDNMRSRSHCHWSLIYGR